MMTAGLVRGALGFGDALFAMPILVLLLPVTAAAPLVALSAATIAAVILLRDWRHVDLSAAWRLVAFGLMAAPLGVWLLKSGDDRVAKGVLGVVVLGFSLWSLARTPQVVLANDRLAPLFGLCAGLLGGAFNTSGPPLVIFGTLRGWSPDQFRATMQTYCIVGSICVASMHTASGLMTPEIVTWFLLCVPGIILMTLLGRVISRAIPASVFIRCIHIALMLIGVFLIVASVLPAGG